MAFCHVQGTESRLNRCTIAQNTQSCYTLNLDKSICLLSCELHEAYGADSKCYACDVSVDV